MSHPDIDALKQKHGALFSLEVGGTLFVFKQLSLGEFAKIDGKEQSPDLEDFIIQAAVVHPEEIPELRTGEYVALCESILKISGWGDENVFLTILSEKRKEAQSFHPEAKALICSYFNMNPLDVDNMGIEEFLSYVGQVELVAQKRLYSDKRDRGKRVPTPVPPPPIRAPVDNKWSGGDVFDSLRMSGIEPAQRSLRERIFNETGNDPISIREAIINKRERPPENLSKGDIKKTVIGKDDYQENEHAWVDGPPI